jgi:hypothetical protein
MSGLYKQPELSKAEMKKREAFFKEMFGDRGQKTEGLWPLVTEGMKTTKEP